jgi:SAM-dependent methyltransferase
MIKKILNIYRNYGIKKVAYTLVSRSFISLIGALYKLQNKLPKSTFNTWAKLLNGKNGIEIGGPSAIFLKNGIFPIYQIIGNLDNSNFSSETIWEGAVSEGPSFEFNTNKTKGFQYVMESTSMPNVISGRYDFIISSHVLEHSANPILALAEWIRIIKEKGILLLVFPHKNGAFDHRRPVTTLEHLI